MSTDDTIEFLPAKSFIERWDSVEDAEGAIAGLGQWICKHTVLNDNLFSFKDHEFQEQIANDTHPRISCMKCSQIGLTELQVRLLLAYSATHSNSRVLYGLPTTTFANTFSKDRVAMTIDSSPKLKSMVAKKNDTVSQKLIGSTTLYIQGMSGKTAGFSLPVYLLIIDELDICDQNIVSRSNSRIRHAPLDPTGTWRGLRRYFGTPSVLDYGIHKEIKLSDTRRYLVQCEHCEKKVLPTTLDLVIPGFEEPFEDFSPSHVYDPNIDLDNSYMSCPSCHGDLTRSLLQPDRRIWVAERTTPGLERGYTIAPWDVPVYNPVPSILRQRSDYKSASEYHNQILGVPYEDAENSFLLSIFKQDKRCDWMDPFNATSGRYYVGVDVGKIFHLVIIKDNPRDPQNIDVVFMTTLKPYMKDGEEVTNAMQVVAIMKAIRARSGVIDSGPDFTSASYVTSRVARTFASEYVRSVDNPLSNYTIKEERHTVKVARTGVLSEVMRAHNRNQITYPNRGTIRKDLEVHFKSLKLVKSEDPSGIVIQTFIKTNPTDHYVHAIAYAWIARQISTEVIGTGTGVAHAPAAVTCKIGEKHESTRGNSTPQLFRR